MDSLFRLMFESKNNSILVEFKSYEMDEIISGKGRFFGFDLVDYDNEEYDPVDYYLRVGYKPSFKSHTVTRVFSDKMSTFDF
jgi:hypothetical protein